MKVQQSIRSKIFKYSAYLSIILLLLLFIIISYTYYKQSLNLKLISSLNELKYIEEEINFITSTSEIYSKSIITDKKVQKNMKKYKDEPSSFNALNQLEIKEQIYHIIQSTDYIDFVTLYSAQKNVLVSTSIADLPSDIPLKESETWHVVESKKSKYLSFIRPFFDIDNGSILGYIQIGIKESKIYSIYSSKSNEAEEIFISFEAISLTKNKEPIKYLSQLNIDDKYDEFIPKIENYPNLNKDSGYIHNIGMPLYFFKKFDRLNSYIVHRVSPKQFFTPSIMHFAIILSMTILGITLSLYISKKISVTITNPLNSLINHTKSMINGSWKTLDYSDFDSKNSDAEILKLIDEFNTMIVARKNLEKELLKAEKEKNTLEIDLLQAQIKPHFLYNTLDNIVALSDLDEKQKLSDLVMNLSTFYRASLSGGKNVIDLKDELDISKAYIKILQIRYIDKFDYKIDCDESLYDSQVPKLLLQPIIENSIYHGIKEISYKGMIKIKIKRNKNDIIIEVKDNGKGLSKSNLANNKGKLENHYGISNINKRIKIQYGKSYGIDIKNHKEGGCLTKIRIKYETKSSNCG